MDSLPRIGGRDVLAIVGNDLQAGFPVAANGRIEPHPGLGYQFGKLHEVRGQELQAAMREIDVHHSPGTHGNVPKAFVAGEYALIVQVSFLPSLVPIIVSAGGGLCNIIRANAVSWLRSACS